MTEQVRSRTPESLLRGLTPWPIGETQTGQSIVLRGPAITTILPYDCPARYLRSVQISPDGSLADGVHLVNAQECQGHQIGAPLLPGSSLGDLLYLTFGVLLRHSPRVPAELLAGKIGVRARDEEFSYRQRVLPGDKVIVTVELLGRRGSLLAGRGWARAGDRRVFEARRCWVGLVPLERNAPE